SNTHLLFIAVVAFLCQVSMFERWKVNFGAIRVQMRAYVARMLMRQLTPAYDLSPPEMQNLLGRAIDSLQRATTKYPRCMLALLRHAAGMICFMCDPEWNQFLYDAKPGYSSIEEETGVLFRPSRQYKTAPELSTAGASSFRVTGFAAMLSRAKS
ncbi:unnamed protein product, partial [Polarella glacialis]